MAERCRYTKKDGHPCRAYALNGKEYCFAHDPESAEKRTLARSMGGSKQIVLHNQIVKFKRGKVKAVMNFVAKTVSDVRDGTISPQMGNSIYIGCNTILKCFELCEVEEKLTKIEEYIEKERKKEAV